ncbi:Synaptotagmin-11 [Aphelenchoides bicaudatus]|nr:Synaptotagmin-11 [Aphelenchoides bicaudatus]
MEINDGASLAAGTMSAQQQMTSIQSAFTFQDPKILLSQQQNQSTASNAAQGRRKLPPEPSLSPQPQSSSNPPPVRRASSNRMLPSPPVSPIFSTDSASPRNTQTTMNAFSPSPSPPFNSNSTDCLRRPSTGRRLPSEPTNFPAAITTSTLPPLAPNNHLQRSASARTTASVNVTNNKAALPPPSPRSSIAAPVPISSATVELTTSNSASAMSRLAPDTSLATTASNGHAQSGSISPRATRNSMTEGSPSFVFARKFSTDVGRDSLSRNGSGSMAHLLEQQHLLRREFTATPDSMIHSNNSSLNHSFEQLCAASTKSSSDGDDKSISVQDPTVHGLDPALYSGDVKTPQTPTNSTSNTDIVANSSSSTTLAQSAATNNENEPRPSGLGLIHCSLQHFPVRKRLRVSVLKIEGLAGELRPDLEIQPFCKVNIIPGKQNKQQTSFVKHGRNAVFNQEFFFDGIESEDLEGKSLAIEVCHQSTQKLGKDLEIGEICVPLKDLTLYTKKEVKIVEEIKHRPNSKKLGKIYINTCIDKEARLTLNIIKVEELPKFSIVGPPDVCVRITLAQGNKNPQTKSSRILKGTCSAVYKEAVMFLISTKKADLQNTRVTIGVHDVLRSVTGDDVIGCAYLGQMGTEKSEIDQWNKTIQNIGKEIKGTHQLRQINQMQVHVSEVPGDEEDYGDEEG